MRVNQFEDVVLVLAHLHRQDDLGEVRGCLEIFGDRSLAPRHGREQKHGDRAVGAARRLVRQLNLLMLRLRQEPVRTEVAGQIPYEVDAGSVQHNVSRGSIALERALRPGLAAPRSAHRPGLRRARSADARTHTPSRRRDGVGVGDGVGPVPGSGVGVIIGDGHAMVGVGDGVGVGTARGRRSGVRLGAGVGVGGVRGRTTPMPCAQTATLWTPGRSGS